MNTITRKLSAAALVLALLMAVGSTASAQSRFGGSMSSREKAGYIGGGAVAGAVLGGLLGGKKGAVIGGLLGAGGGAGVVYYKGKREEDRYGRYYDDRRYRDYRGYDSRDYAYRGYDDRRVGYDDRRVYDPRNFGYSRDRNRCANGFRR